MQKKTNHAENLIMQKNLIMLKKSNHAEKN